MTGPARSYGRRNPATRPSDSAAPIGHCAHISTGDREGTGAFSRKMPCTGRIIGLQYCTQSVTHLETYS